MSGSVFNTAYASLDCAVAKSKLQDASTDADQLRQVLTDCFFDGSTAAAGAAALYVMDSISTEKDLLLLIDIVKSLPTAIPERTASSLAQVCIFVASFDVKECKEPLNSFCYADERLKQIAVRETVSALDQVMQTKPQDLDEFLERKGFFLADALKEGSDVQIRFGSLRGLLNIAVMYPRYAKKRIVQFVLESTVEREYLDVDAVDIRELQEFEAYYASELVSLADGVGMVAQIVLRCLLRSLEWSSVTNLYSLWMSRNSKVKQCIDIIGLDMFIFLLTMVGATTICKGRISECRQSLAIALDTLRSSNEQACSFDQVAALCIASTCIAIGAMCSACGADDVAKQAATLRETVTSNFTKVVYQWSGTGDASSHGGGSLQYALFEGRRWKCPKAVFCLGLLRKISSMWKDVRALLSWLEQDVDDLSRNEAFADVQDADSRNLEENYKQLSVQGKGSNTEAGLDAEDLLPSICLTGSILACLSHQHSQVRYHAAKSLSSERRSDTLLFFLPAVISNLQSETKGVISALCLREVLAAPCLLAHKETAKVALQTILAVVSRGRQCFSTASYQTGLMSIALATKHAPGIAITLLLDEVEKLKTSFGLLSSDTKAATCAAILQLVTLRPARGPSFIPFTSQCITRENMDVAPLSCALSFDAMNIMCEEQVLDGVKAVKIVLKSFPGVLDVDAAARASYLRLLGRVAPMSTSKKGRSVAEKVIHLLRGALISLHPPKTHRTSQKATDTHLTWEEIEICAESLLQYNPEETLRIDHLQEEPLSNAEAEKERQTGIARECMVFTQQLISITELSRQAENHNTTSNLQSLVNRLVQHEWENRARSEFDARRIAKLRSTSEALRRARGVTTEDDGLPERGLFLRGVRVLPIGVIRGVCERCTGEWGGGEEGDDLRDAGGRATALCAMASAGAVSGGGLNWAGMVEEMIGTGVAAEERAMGVRVLRCISGGTMAEVTRRGRWFAGSAAFETSITAAERKELFRGGVEWCTEETAEGIRRGAVGQWLGLFVEVVGEVGGGVQTDSVVEALVDVYCREGVGEKDGEIVRALAGHMKRLSGDRVGRLLQADHGGKLGEVDVRKVKLVCQTERFEVMTEWIARVVSAEQGEGVGAVEWEMVRLLGRAVARRKWEERRSVVYDMCEGGGGGVVRQVVAGWALGVGALQGRGWGGVGMAEAVCARGERAVVARLVRKMGGENVEW